MPDSANPRSDSGRRIRDKSTSFASIVTLLAFSALLLLAGCGGKSNNIDEPLSDPIPDTVNEPPVLSAIGSQTVEVGEPLTLRINASDPDGPLPLTLAASEAPPNSVFIDQGDGTGSFQWTPKSEQATSTPHVVVFSAMDSAGLSANTQVEITVLPGEPQLLAPVTDQKAAVVGELLTFEIFAANPGVLPLTLTAAGLPPDAAFVDHHDGTGTFTWMPSLKDIAVSPHAVAFTASDSGDPAITETITVKMSVTFADDFSSGDGNWRFLDDISSPASSWEVIEDRLIQHNKVESRNSFTGSYHRGTYAYLPGGLALTDYRVVVDAVYLATEQANDIGIMFRYQDNDNYYRLSFNGRYSFARLEKRVGGEFVPLAVNARGYLPNEPLRIIAEVRGDQITVSANGESLFAIQDDALSSGTVALYTQGNAAFERITLAGPRDVPTIAITSPAAFTVTQSAQLESQAFVSSFTIGSEVEFRLNGMTSVFKPDPPFTVTFPELAAGEYTIEAFLRDGSGEALAQATHPIVGVQGIYFISIGDSITNGVGDRYWADNISQNGRLRGVQGYQATLVDLLDNSQQRPVIVYNNGIGGDRSNDAANSRLDSILDRHPGSEQALVMLGTNDSRDTPSGLGCSGDSCIGTFKGNMDTIVESLSADGKGVIVARIPPVFANSSRDDAVEQPLELMRNQRIQQYNAVIDNELQDIAKGPDFFGYFLGDGVNRFSLYREPIHPNSLGYAVKAHLWQNALNPDRPVALPFILENLAPSTISPFLKQNLLQAGNTYYVDEAYRLTEIPTVLRDGIWIEMANADANSMSETYLTFDADRPVRVYVAYDAAADARPEWMAPFQDTGLRVRTDNPQAPVHAVFRRDYPIGTINLGGNKATGAAGVNAHYIVIVRPQ